MDELATKLVDSLTKVETALETMAPTAFQALVEAAYIGGIMGLFGVIALVLLFLLCVKGFVLGLSMFDSMETNEYGRKPNNPKAEALLGFSGAIGAISMFFAFMWIVASPLVLKIINPTAYVVKSLLNQ